MAIITGPAVERIRSATKLHDVAIHNWAISTRTDRVIEAQLIQSLHAFHKACCCLDGLLLVAPAATRDNAAAAAASSTDEDVRASSSASASSSRLRLRRPISLTLSVDIQPSNNYNKALDCYSRAFLLSTIDNQDCNRGDSTMNSESLTLMAAIIFYNVGLFYHIRLHDNVVCLVPGGTLQQQPQPQCPPRNGSGVTATTTTTCRVIVPGADLDCWAVRQYYEKANGLLTSYLDDTREPLWTLQAALWHNLADTYRYRVGNDPVAWIYFEQLESIRGWVDDKSDRLFFERAIAMARMQQNACLSATAA